MLTVTPVQQVNQRLKRAVLLLIGLNTFTILASVMIISSGIFVANANSISPSKRCPATLASSLTKPVFSVKTFASSYTGSMLTTKGQIIGKITSMVFTGTPPKSSKDQGSLSEIKLDITGSGVSQKLRAPDGSPLPPLPDLSFDLIGGNLSFNQFVLSPSGTSTITITFKSVHFVSSTTIDGNYSITDTSTNSTNNFTGFQGPWTVHS